MPPQRGGARRLRVRMRGLEPPRPEGHTDLNRARLPIPPHPRGQGQCSPRRLLASAEPAVATMPRREHGAPPGPARGGVPDAAEVRVIDRGGGDHFEVRVTAPALRRPVPDRAAPARLRRRSRALVGRHHPRASDQDERNDQRHELHDKIKDVIDDSDVALFMKGTPDAIMCGNSRARAGGAAACRRADHGGRRAARHADPRGPLGDLRLADDPAGLRQGRADRRRRHRRGDGALRRARADARREARRGLLGRARRAHRHPRPRLPTAPLRPQHLKYLVGVRRRLARSSITFFTVPSASITNVERTMPMYVVRSATSRPRRRRPPPPRGRCRRGA